MAKFDWLTARPIAHRGLHDIASGVVENSRSAVLAAIAGRYGIEVDLQLSADGEAMVHHDDTLDRLTEGRGRLDRMTAADLAAVTFKGTADRMMTLSGLCDLVGGRVALLLELKSHPTGAEQLAARVAHVLAGRQARVAAMSFDPAIVAALRRRAPDLATGLTAQRAADPHTPAATVGDVIRTGAQFIAYSVKDLPAAIPLAARHLLRMPLLTWTVRTDDDRRRAAMWADQMIFEGFRP